MNTIKQYEQTGIYVDKNGYTYTKTDGEFIPLKQSVIGADYRSVTHNKQTYYVHRVVLFTFGDLDIFDVEDENLEVNHIDGQKWNNAFDNLEWVTSSENMKHCWANGLMKPKITRSSANGRKTFFTDQQIREMRRLYDEYKYTQQQIAIMFNTIQPSVSRIVRGLRRADA